MKISYFKKNRLKERTMFCSSCGKEINDSEKFCPHCGAPITNDQSAAREALSNEYEPGLEKSEFSEVEDNASNKFEDISQESQKATDFIQSETKKTVDKFTEKVNVMMGGEGAVDLRLIDLFSGIFRRHSSDEADEIFICGTKYTTPPVDKISTAWPKPWLFTRVGLLFLVTYFLLKIACVFGINVAIPGTIFFGSMAGPIAILIFFFEVNAPRNISIFEVAKVFMLGGAASLIITAVLYILDSNGELYRNSAISTGIIEEIAKIVMTAYVISKAKGRKYILNGMLYGGAVGAGFAAFESMGYALNYYLLNNSFEEMISVIRLRGLLSPGGHVAWAAMEGAFLMLVIKSSGFKWSALISSKYIGMCAIPVILHTVWDISLLDIVIKGFLIKHIALIAIAWLILLVILNRGLKEINELNTKRDYVIPSGNNQALQAVNG